MNGNMSQSTTKGTISQSLSQIKAAEVVGQYEPCGGTTGNTCSSEYTCATRDLSTATLQDLGAKEGQTLEQAQTAWHATQGGPSACYPANMCCGVILGFAKL